MLENTEAPKLLPAHVVEPPQNTSVEVFRFTCRLAYPCSKISTQSETSNGEAEPARTNRLASVTMEWTSASDGSNPSRRFVAFYAYTGADERDKSPGIPFQPDLDGRGQKAIPGLCNTCHGGAPRNFKANGTYRGKGSTRSLFLPLDLDNFEFDPNPTRPELARAAQEAEYKKMTQIVLLSRQSRVKLDDLRTTLLAIDSSEPSVIIGFHRRKAGHLESTATGVLSEQDLTNTA